MSPSISRLGFYYSPDDRQYTRSSLAAALPVLKSVGARYLVLKASSARAVPEEFIASLLHESIRPIVHLPALVGQVPLEDLQSLLGTYARWGINEVVVYDRPNLKRSWANGTWSQGNLAQQFADMAIPILEMQYENSLRPILPALEPGGDYWDLAFLQSLLRILDQRLRPEIKEKLSLAIYLWDQGKPLDWGAGGPDAWPEARPYRTPSGSQDHMGLHIFEWYAAVSNEILGRTLPMLVVAGGSLENSSTTIVGPDRHLERNLAIARMLLDETIPSYVENFAYYCLYDPAGVDAASSQWLSGPDQHLPILDALRKLFNQSSSKRIPSDDARFPHYVLLPTTDQVQAMRAWAEVGPYAIDHQWLVGFSVDQARKAKKVTLAGDETVFPASIVDLLSAAGCEVNRFDGFQTNFNAGDAPIGTPINENQE